MTIHDIVVSNTNKRKKADVRSSILHGTKIEEDLNVIAVVSNPCNFAKRYKLAREFIQRMEDTPNVKLYVVELVYGDQEFAVTSSGNPRHLMVRTSTAPIWHKENMIDMGVKHLLPPDWKAFAWIDADIEFEDPLWVDGTLKILNGDCDVMQLFGLAIDMDASQNTMSVFSSFCRLHNLERPRNGKGTDYWHPGFAWAMTREFYEKVSSIYSLSILGSGDHCMAMAFIGSHKEALNSGVSEGFKKSLREWAMNAEGCTLGYHPGTVKHYFHGSKINRRYHDRWKILVRWNFDPYLHLQTDDFGLLTPSLECPEGLLREIMEYFWERKEDD